MNRKWQIYYGANDYVEMTEDMDSSMLASLGRRRRRRFLTGIVVVLLLFIGTVWVVGTPGYLQWLSRVAPPVARFLVPSLVGSTEKYGIRLELVDAAREGETLLVHLTMEDTEGDRLTSLSAPGWVGVMQDEDRALARFIREYDPETGLLHLQIICRPGEHMPDFDWDRGIMVQVYDLETHSTTGGYIGATWTVQVEVG